MQAVDRFPRHRQEGTYMDINTRKRKPRIIFITGGARSGKSSFALREAEKIAGKKLFIATAQPLDAEMTARIQMHRKERGQNWDTAEVPLEIGNTLKNQGACYHAILLDCLTLWLFNVMEVRAETVADDAKAAAAIDALVDDLKDIQQSPQRLNELAAIFIVSNEVGMGIVPDNRMARLFRDMAGRLNQKIAQSADEAYLMVSGLPLQVK